MAQPAPQPEQSDSMEDILQSIKRIIEDDTTPGAAADSADVLDLTQVVKEDGTTTELAPVTVDKVKQEIAGAAPTEDVMASIDAIFAPEKPNEAAPAEPAAPKMTAAAPAAATAPAKPTSKTIVMEDGIMSDQAAQAAAAALKPIVDSGQKDYSIPRINSPELRNGNTVEDLLLEALRPLLKSWLDEHLPTIVQKIVEKEVKRIVTFHQD